jgi:cytoskeleton protein RodZ
VERFKAEIAGRSDTNTPAITVIDEDAEHRMPQGWKIMAGVVVVLVLYGAYQLAASADRALNEPAVTPAPQLMHRPVARKPKVQDEQLTVTQPLTRPLDTSLPMGDGVTGAPTVPGAPAPGTAPANPNGIQSSGVAVPPPLPMGQVYGDVTKASRVVLRAREATRILVQGPGGRIIQNRLLKPGDSYHVPNITGLTLTTSNAGAVQLELDGSVAGVAGKSDETAEALSLDPQSIMDRNSGNHGR